MSYGRFDYVKYDPRALDTQASAKGAFSALGEAIESIEQRDGKSRETSLALTKLEESYLWLGKHIRNDQVKRNGSAPLQENRDPGGAEGTAP